MPKPPRRKHSVAEMRANPKWRRYLTDAQLTPAQRAQRTRNTALRSDPLAPVPTLRDLEGQAGTLVDTQQAGDTAAIKAEQDRADAEFRTRSGMYQGLANFQTAGAQKAFQNVNNSVNALIAANNAGSAQDTSMLAAALKKADDDQRAAYAAMGVAPSQPGQGGATPPPGQVPQDVTAERLAALGGVQAGVAQQVGQTGAAQVGAEGAMGVIPGQGLALNLANLTGERNQTNKEIQTKRDTLTANRKGLLRQAVRDLQDFELAKRQFGDQHANMLFQQYMAGKEFDEKVKQQSFAEWLQTSQLTGVTAPGGPPGVPTGSSTIPGRAQDTADRVAGAQVTGVDPVTGRETVDARNQRLTRDIDWFNARTNRTQAEAAIAAALREADNTKDANKKKAAEQRAARIAKGITALDAFLAPTQGEGAPPSDTSRYPVGQSTALTDSKGNAVTHPASQAEADAINKRRQGSGSPPIVAGDPVPTTGRPYVRRFDAALAKLKSQGLTQSDALRVLSMSTFTDWNRKAKYMLSRMKRRGRGGPAQKDRPSGTPKPGGSGAPGYGGPT